MTGGPQHGCEWMQVNGAWDSEDFWLMVTLKSEVGTAVSPKGGEGMRSGSAGEGVRAPQPGTDSGELS